MSSTPTTKMLQVSSPHRSGMTSIRDHSWQGGLSQRELLRRACHMAPGFLPFFLWSVPHKDPLAPLLTQIIIGLFCIIVAAFFLNWSRIARAGVGAADRAAAIWGYAVAVLATILLAPDHLEIGLTVLAILAFGDGAATFVGHMADGPRLPWNRDKTFAGLAGFLAFGLPMATLIYWGESNNPQQSDPSATVLQSLGVVGVGICLAAIAESLPMRLNDNIRVGIAATVGLLTAHAAVFGL